MIISNIRDLPDSESADKFFDLNDDMNDIACVVVGFDRYLTYQKVEKACELLTRDFVDFVADYSAVAVDFVAAFVATFF